MSAVYVWRPTPRTERGSSVLPFEASRRLIGPNLFFAQCGAQLETCGIEPDEALLAEWERRVRRACAALGWPAGAVAARRHARGASLALSAPPDALFVATEINEWALCTALMVREPTGWTALEAELRAAALDEDAPCDPDPLAVPQLEEGAALERFRQLAAREACPGLGGLLAAASARALPHVQDESFVTLGACQGAQDFPLAQLPEPRQVPWDAIHDVPTAVVTGSNGKTTSVRLLAAHAAAQGWLAAYCCTDGVFLGAEPLAAGDYSGPDGARRVLRARAASAAIVETARGGILRRGIALSQAQVALVTNVSPDHFGEYGVDDLDALADVKLTVAALLGARGVLVLNADDLRLLARAPRLAQRFGHAPRIAWFALDADHAVLRAHRHEGGATCGVRGGRLQLALAGDEHDLGEVAAMPLTVGGRARYNVANLAGAALAAALLGVAADAIRSVNASFGAKAADNFGRMMRFERNGVQILVDYAHNEEGLRGLLQVAQQLRSGGRLGMLLGHAGNRQDAEIEGLARVAAEFAPALIVIKENEAHLRGRAAGEIPRVIRAALRGAGLPESALPMRDSELAAVRCALDWARAGDVLALPVHSAAARRAVLELLAGS
jgi:cyanophycin synthetase